MRINGSPPIAPITQTPTKEKAGKTSFTEALADTMSDAAAAERQAETATASFLKGEAGVHETIIAQEKASLQLRFALTTKNKAVQAYKDLMSTQI